MSTKLEKLFFAVDLIDRVSGPLSKIHNKLNMLGMEQLVGLRSGFHSVGVEATGATAKVTALTAAIGAATAATAALVSAAMPLAAMFGTGFVSAISTMHISGVNQETEQLSKATGMDSETIRTYQLASKVTGLESGFGELGDIGGIFEEVAGKMGELDDKKSDVTKAFKEIGLSAKQLRNLQPHEVLNKAADQMERLGKTEREKIEFLSELAGDAEKLLPLLGKNNAEFQRLANHSKAVGAIITPEQSKLMANYKKEVSMMKIGLDGVANTFAEVGGNFVKYFGPEINQWFIDNHKAMRSWANDSIAEVKRLHTVFKNGGMSAVWADLFPNLSAFLSRTGAFFSGFNQGFMKPFLATSKATYDKVVKELGNTVGGAKALGRSFGESIEPIFSKIMEATGDAVIFIEKNWALIKHAFAWSPLGLIINNWDGIIAFLKPIGATLRDLAAYFGITAKGVDTSGSALGTLFGVMAAGLGILVLNKLAFGALYSVVLLYKGALVILKATTIAWAIATAIATSPILLIIGAVAALAAGAYWLYTRWDTTKAALADTTWGGLLSGAIDLVLLPFEALQFIARTMIDLWGIFKANLSDTAWGKPVFEFLDSIAGYLEPIIGFLDRAAAGFKNLKNMDLSLPDISIPSAGDIGDSISNGWNSLTAAVGFGDEPTKGAGKATGGVINRNYLHRVNELAPELYTVGKATYLMSGAQGGMITPINTRFLEQLAPAANDHNNTSNVKPIRPIQSQVPRGGIGAQLASISQRNTQHHTQQNGRVIHIENLTIQTDNLDADKFADELEMVAQ